jgi:hypothetical protein
MATAYPEPGPVVWKDPRACLLLPYWRELLPAPLTAVFVWREPLAVARSLQRRDGIPLAEGLALWERYNRSAAAGLQGVDTYVLDYDAVVQDPRPTLGAVADWLGGLERFAPWADTWDRDAAGRAVDTGLRHETAEGAPDDGALPGDHRALLDWLEARPGSHLPLGDEPPGPTSVWPEVVLAARRERAVLAHEIERTHRTQLVYDQTMDTLRELLTNREVKLGQARADLARAQAELDGVRLQLDNTLASTSWRVTRPLRSVLERRND